MNGAVKRSTSKEHHLLVSFRVTFFDSVSLAGCFSHHSSRGPAFACRHSPSNPAPQPLPEGSVQETFGNEFQVASRPHEGFCEPFLY